MPHIILNTVVPYLLLNLKWEVSSHANRTFDRHHEMKSKEYEPYLAEDTASLVHFARLTESEAIARECEVIVQKLLQDGIQEVDNPSIIIQMAVQSLEPDRERRNDCKRWQGTVSSSLASFGRSDE